jgi:hypothetical protein
MGTITVELVKKSFKKLKKDYLIAKLSVTGSLETEEKTAANIGFAESLVPNR